MTTTSDGRVLTHRVGERGEVSVSIAAGRLEVSGIDGDSVAVRDLEGRDLDDQFEIERSEGRFIVRQRERSGFDLGFGRRSRGSARLAVEVPRHASVSLGTASGDLKVTGLDGEQRYRTASGEIHAVAVAGPIGIDAVSGDVRIEAAGTVDLSGRLVSGDLAVRGGILRSVAVATTSGDIRLESPVEGPGPFSIQTVSGDALVASAGNLRVEARTLTGDVGSDLEHRSESGLGQRSLVLGNGSRTLAFRSISGNLRVAAAFAPPAPPAAEPAVPPMALQPPPPATTRAESAVADPRLVILRDLEAGRIDVATATRLLAELEEAPDA
jgi:DUF4097 and DUF4098 domain-containing protein YvlB